MVAPQSVRTGPRRRGPHSLRDSGAAAFGSEALALEQSREVWGFAWLDSWQQDIRYALRGLRKSPAFTLGVIGAIALGIGLNTTVFTVFNAYVLRPHAVRDPYTLYQVEWSGRDFTASEVAELPLREAFGYHNTGALLEGRPAMGQAVTGNYFTILGAAIAEGRPLLPDDRGGVMVLSFDAWRNKFGGAPGMIGRTLHLRGGPYEVVGIAAPGSRGSRPSRSHSGFRLARTRTTFASSGGWIPVAARASV